MYISRQTIMKSFQDCVMHVYLQLIIFNSPPPTYRQKTFSTLPAGIVCKAVPIQTCLQNTLLGIWYPSTPPKISLPYTRGRRLFLSFVFLRDSQISLCSEGGCAFFSQEVYNVHSEGSRNNGKECFGKIFQKGIDFHREKITANSAKFFVNTRTNIPQIFAICAKRFESFKNSVIIFTQFTPEILKKKRFIFRHTRFLFYKKVEIRLINKKFLYKSVFY